MTGSKHFNSSIIELGGFGHEVSNDCLKNETMFFNSGLAFAYDNGGDATKSFIDRLPAEWQSDLVVFDSRVHMLMPGWYPAIPGWHHDDVPRPEIPTGQHFITAGQPNYDNPQYLSEHILGLINGDICPTQFAIGECSMPEIKDGELIYREWHKEVNRLCDESILNTILAKDRTLYQFDWQTFHQSTMATGHGWRWFGRVSRKTDRAYKITNEIRRNAQVYLEFPMEGW